ncbi:MAG: chemotaxis protein CheW, partial [Ignavibacteriales bacterium]|nr:chemotaxis protein CheW [Ignavibacteriales bacterium]
PKSVTEPPPSVVAGIEAEYITAVGKLEDRLLILLDLEKVLSTEEHEELKKVA